MLDSMMMMMTTTTNLRLVVLFLFVVVPNSHVSASGGIFHVQNKFSGQHQRSLTALKHHDRLRHGRRLSGVDLPLGGDGMLVGTWVYYTKLKIGSPPKDYYVSVDTGSDILWVNCFHCTHCPKKTDLGMKLTRYDAFSSVSSELINCDDGFCTAFNEGPVSDCFPGTTCEYIQAYADESSTAGYFVRDVVHYDSVSGNLETTSANSSVVFGCGVQQMGNLDQTHIALDGLLGFGQSETSMISQIAASGSIKKIFAHCLDGENGGGIFAMGHVVQPKVKTTRLIPNTTNYYVNLEAIAVGNDIVQLPKGVLTGSKKQTMIDSGTTLAYFPEEIYEPLVKKIISDYGELKVHTIEERFQCFEYNRSVDAGFPTVTLTFEGALQLMVYPRDYLFQDHADTYCIGFQSGQTQTPDWENITILGELVLSNKFVLYDLENQTIGWTEYNCSSTIAVKDEQSNAIYQVGAHNLRSFAPSEDMTSIVILLLLCSIFHILIYRAHHNYKYTFHDL